MLFTCINCLLIYSKYEEVFNYHVNVHVLNICDTRLKLWLSAHESSEKRTVKLLS